eukprot:TRINITY_DN1590_c0_g1_i7.p1 TRINITY_DN1590_c0_g1~~TRINITY_DN1590_c0_g1_i7.p1  ORF type:complete len:295 (-),score=-14.27 TRINITY_DN1590_c0_g1_i7:2121-3005(-)
MIIISMHFLTSPPRASHSTNQKDQQLNKGKNLKRNTTHYTPILKQTTTLKHHYAKNTTKHNAQKQSIINSKLEKVGRVGIYIYIYIYPPAKRKKQQTGWYPENYFQQICCQRNWIKRPDTKGLSNKKRPTTQILSHYKLNLTRGTKRESKTKQVKLQMKRRKNLQSYQKHELVHGQVLKSDEPVSLCKQWTQPTWQRIHKRTKVTTLRITATAHFDQEAKQRITKSAKQYSRACLSQQNQYKPSIGNMLSFIRRSLRALKSVIMIPIHLIHNVCHDLYLVQFLISQNPSIYMYF